MKDRVLLILVAGMAALSAWAYWHYVGENAGTALVTFMLFVLAIDNVLLRRRLRAITGNHLEK